MQKLKSDTTFALKKVIRPSNLFWLIILIVLTMFRLMLSIKSPYLSIYLLVMMINYLFITVKNY